MNYDEWIAEVRRLAKLHDLEWIIGSADLRDAYNDGMTPAEALESEVAEMASNT